MARKVTPSPETAPLPPAVPFSRIIGNRRPLAILEAAMRAGRVAHAYLFLGPAGTGKFTAAAAFAKKMLCLEKEPGESDSCGECQSCRLFDRGSHPDCSILRPDGAFIKISQMSELQNSAALKPYLSGSKWFILDPADQMKPEAANRFLKTLEEPPDHCHIVLISSKPQALLGTIRSRCQVLPFSAPPTEEILPILMEKRGLNREEALRLWSLSGKNIGTALETEADELLSERNTFVDLISSVWLDDIEPLFKLPGKLAGDQDSLRLTLARLETWLRDVLLAKSGAPPEHLTHRDISARVMGWSEEINTEGLLRTLDLITGFRRSFSRNLNPALVLETLLLSLREGRTRKRGTV